MFRRLRVLAAFFLLPISLVLSLPGAAVAGTTETLHFDLTSFVGEIPAAGEITTVSCSLGVGTTVTPSGGLAVVSPSSYCQGGPDTSPLSCQVAEPGCGTYTLKFNGIGGLCGSGTLAQEAMAESWYDTFGTGVYIFGSVSIADGCDPTEVCLSYHNGGSSVAREDCVSSSLDPIEEGSTEPDCALATVHSLYAQNLSLNVIDADFANGRRSWGGSVTWKEGQSSTAGRWISYFVMWGGSGGTGDQSSSGVSGRVTRYFQKQVDGTGVFSEVDQVHHNTYFKGEVTTRVQAAQQAGADLHQVGVGVVWVPGTGPYYLPAQTATERVSANKMGLHDPENCAFYYGEKIANIADGTWDEPGSILPPDPTPPPVFEPPAVEPPVAPPVPEDEPGFWGAILALLKSIWGAITSLGGKIAALAGQIVDGITGAFEGLFVPDDGYLESRYTSIETKWADTSPAKYADAVTGFSVGAASGCEGLPLSLTLPGGVEVDQHIGAACSGPLASTAGIVRGVLTAVFVVGGVFACIRAIGSGLGWDPGVGRGAGA